MVSHTVNSSPERKAGLAVHGPCLKLGSDSINPGLLIREFPKGNPWHAVMNAFADVTNH